MKDVGHEETEAILRKLEKRISEEYKKAEQEVEEKLNEYLRKFQKKDEIKHKALENGLITQKEYDQWLTGQIMMGKRWQEMRDTLAQDFTNANKIAKAMAYNEMPDVFALNHNYGTYQVEHGAMVDTSYTLYDRDTVINLFNDNNEFYHAPGKKVTARINEGLDKAWNKKNVQSCMLQGILQGESIPKMATRLSQSVGEQNRKAAIRNTRTMATGVQNAGRVASYDRAISMGIKVKKQWLAALDNRTRHWHRELDGVSVDNDKPFKNEYGEIMYPGDPSANGANIYNCRCTLIADIAGFENDASDLSLRNTRKLGDMSYEEWKNEHKSESDPITKQDDIANTMRIGYEQEYKDLKNLNSLIDEQQKMLNKYGNTTNIMLFGTEDDVARWQELQKWTSMDEKEIMKTYQNNVDNWENVLKNQTDKQMEKYTEQLLDVATDKELSALNMWTSETYADINRYMRYGHNVGDVSIDAANDIKNCLNKTKTTEDIVVRRGTGTKEILSGIQGDWRNDLDLLTGHIYKDDGFVATSPFATGGFSGSGYNQAELFIHVPEGTHGAYIAKEAHNEMEKEFLLQSGYNYKIIKAEYRPNPYFPEEKDLKIWVEVIPND